MVSRAQRSKELELDIWARIETWLASRKAEYLVDTSFFEPSDFAAYSTAIQRVKLVVERKAGGDPDVGERAHKRRMYEL